MAETATGLTRLKGVGRVMAERLERAGCDSLAKIAHAGEEGLRKVQGLPARSLKSIVEQARQLSQDAEQGEAERARDVRQQLAEVRESMQSLAEQTRERFQQELSGKTGKKLSADLIRLEDALVQLGNRGGKRAKRTGKALTKASQRIGGLEEATLKKIRKRVKRARKAVTKAL